MKNLTRKTSQLVRIVMVVFSLFIITMLFQCTAEADFSEMVKAPSIIYPAPGSQISEVTSLQFQGGSDAVDAYDIYLDGTIVTSLDGKIYQPGDTISYELESPLEKGDHTWMIVAMNDFQRMSSEMAQFYYNNTISINGQIVDAHTLKPIAGATVQLIYDDNSFSSEVQTDQNGNYSIEVPIEQKGYASVIALKDGYASLTKKRNIKELIVSCSFQILSNKTVQIQKGEVKQVTDVTKRASVTVPSNIVRRMDGEMVQFPISVSVNFIDPKKDLRSMPGVNMLSHDPNTGEIRPLTSIGAVVIKGLDATGAELRVDRTLVEETGQSATMNLDLGEWTGGSLPADMEIWMIDPEKGSDTWQSIEEDTQLVINKEKTSVDSILKNLPEGYMVAYGNNLIGRILYTDCPLPEYFMTCVTGLKLSDTIDDKGVLTNLFPQILVDNMILRDIKDPTLENNCLPIFEMPNYGTVFDAKMNGEWEAAGSYFVYSVDSSSILLTKAPVDTADFSFDPLYQQYEKFCALATGEEDVFGKEDTLDMVPISGSFTDINLVPYNCDQPWSATPISFSVEEVEGDGLVEIEVNVETTSGTFLVAETFYNPNAKSQLNLLIPGGNQATIRVNAHPEKEGSAPEYIATFPIPASTDTYFQSPNEFGVADSKGNVPNWIVLGHVKL